MRTCSLQPGTLWPALRARTEQALRCGALQPIETIATVVEDGGVRFVIRQVSSLMNKPRAEPRPSGEPRPFVDPFLPYDPDLFVADVSPTHVALLNKFNVIDHHLLIVTRAFEPQEALLDLADFEAWFQCLGEFDGLGFYNGGRDAGASQPHKHLQIVPLPLGDRGQSLPIDSLVQAVSFEGDVAKLSGFAFEHAFTTLPLLPPEQAAVQAVSRYRMLLEAVGLGAGSTDTHPHQSGAYNLLLTRRWMLLVPRRVEAAHGVAVNALAFGGSLFVRDREQMTTVRRVGPMSILRDVGMPRQDTRTGA